MAQALGAAALLIAVIVVLTQISGALKSPPAANAQASQPTPICPVVSLSADQQRLLTEGGVASPDWGCVDYIFSHESGWCPTKWEGQIGSCPTYHGTPTDPSVGYGECQSTPAWKMRDAGADWATNPVTQTRWCAEHADGYGGWSNSYQHWLSHHNW